MSSVAPPARYKIHRFPTEIIRHAVWLYFRFCLSFRDVEGLLKINVCLVHFPSPLSSLVYLWKTNEGTESIARATVKKGEGEKAPSLRIILQARHCLNLTLVLS